MADRDERVALAAFLAGAALAGGNAVAIRFSNRELEPLWGAGLRFALAATLFFCLMAALRLPRPGRREMTGAALYGSFTFGGAFALAYYALVDLHAGFGQVLLALVPLAALLLTALQRQERLRPAGGLGAALALAGVAWMSSASLDHAPLLSVLAAVGSAFCFAQGAVIVRAYPGIHPVTMNAVGMTVGAALLLAGSLLAGESIELPDRDATRAAITYLVALGSVVVFLLYLVVLRHWTASRTSYQFVLIPFVTVGLSAWLDDERLGAGLVLGGLLVLSGVYLGALRPAADST